MILDPKESECEIHQKIIVCRDKGEPREHRAINTDGIFEVRKYHLDGIW